MTRNLAKFQGKFWCFTINNPTIETHPPNIWPDVEYCIWQFEAGDNDTPHLQGYVCFRKVKRLNWIKENTVYEAHWEPRMGTHAQAKHYCMKPVDDCDCKDCLEAIGQRIAGPWEHGDDTNIANGQGERSDIDHIKDMVKEGKSELDIADEHFGVWCRNHKAIERYRMLLGTAEHRTWITKVIVLWGPPGIGKSRRARHEAGPNAYWLSRPEGDICYWDRYNGEENIVIDEFSGWMKRESMQKLCDSTPTRVRVFYGETEFLGKTIWITSNEPPSQWWRNIGLGPMERRLTGEHGTVIHMTEQWQAPPPPCSPTLEDWLAEIDLSSPLQTLPLDETLIPLHNESLMNEYAMFGTPESPPRDDRDEHSQEPLSRCPTCMARTDYPEMCEACIERTNYHRWPTEHDAERAQYFYDQY